MTARALVWSSLAALAAIGARAHAAPADDLDDADDAIGAHSRPPADRSDRPPTVELETGLAGGGAPFASGTGGPLPETTARASALAFVVVRMPAISPRALEAYYVLDHGVGLELENDDLDFGRVNLHILDVGVFAITGDPLSVQRVPRRWDATLGFGANVRVAPRITASLDWRMFVPLDVWSVLTSYGDASRLIGMDIVTGGQLWAGASYRW